MLTESTLNQMFTYHPPTEEQKGQYQAIRAAGREMAAVIMQNTPACPDQTVAIRKLREAVMTANAAIAIEGSRRHVG